MRETWCRVLTRRWAVRPEGGCEEPENVDDIFVRESVESDIPGDLVEQYDSKRDG